MVVAAEPGEQFFLAVGLRVEPTIPVDIGVNNQIRRAGNHHAVADHRQPQRRDQVLILHEHMGPIGPAVAGGVGQNHDPVTFFVPAVLLFAIPETAVVDRLGHPDPSFGVNVDVGGVEEHRARSPETHLHPLRHHKGFGRDDRFVRAKGGRTQTHHRQPSPSHLFHHPPSRLCPDRTHRLPFSRT